MPPINDPVIINIPVATPRGIVVPFNLFMTGIVEAILRLNGTPLELTPYVRYLVAKYPHAPAMTGLVRRSEMFSLFI
jgi:hypothetical protein